MPPLTCSWSLSARRCLCHIQTRLQLNEGHSWCQHEWPPGQLGVGSSACRQRLRIDNESCQEADFPDSRPGEGPHWPHAKPPLQVMCNLPTDLWAPCHLCSANPKAPTPGPPSNRQAYSQASRRILSSRQGPTTAQTPHFQGFFQIALAVWGRRFYLHQGGCPSQHLEKLWMQPHHRDSVGETAWHTGSASHLDKGETKAKVAAPWGGLSPIYFITLCFFEKDWLLFPRKSCLSCCLKKSSFHVIFSS